jgi:site-specific DNA-cytosine methylase
MVTAQLPQPHHAMRPQGGAVSGTLDASSVAPGVIHVCSDFSGMDVASMALHEAGIPMVLLSASESNPDAAAFLRHNHRPRHLRAEAAVEPRLGGRQVHVYTAGFPCQPFSGLGLLQGTQDARGRGNGADISLRRIIRLRPTTFLLENVTNFLTSQNGMVFRRTVKALERAGYTVEHAVLNAKDFGLPQSRARLFMVGRLGHGLPPYQFPRPRSVPAARLADFLDPPEPGESPNNRPPQETASKNVDDAISYCLSRGIPLDGRDLVMDPDTSTKFVSRPKYILPCLTASHTDGPWLLCRGRRMRAHEIIACQGIKHCLYNWPGPVAQARMAGNGIALNVIRPILSDLVDHVRWYSQHGPPQQPATDPPCPLFSSVVPTHPPVQTVALDAVDTPRPRLHWRQASLGDPSAAVPADTRVQRRRAFKRIGVTKPEALGPRQPPRACKRRRGGKKSLTSVDPAVAGEDAAAASRAAAVARAVASADVYKTHVWHLLRAAAGEHLRGPLAPKRCQ